MECERGSQGLLRVTIDRLPSQLYADGMGGAINVDDCELVTRQLKYLLEVENVVYHRLEVSSPGLDRPLRQVADYDACIFPGGCWNPDFLRADKDAQGFVRDMLASGKPTCAICHGQWVMVSAGILKGRKATAVWNIHPDLANAGATVLDEPCVVDGNLITAR
ncbi:MAG: hypothetical protein RL268_2405, partial [Pseudomonadota bacterium]